MEHLQGCMVSKEEYHYIWPRIEFFLCPWAVRNSLDLSEEPAAEEVVVLAAAGSDLVAEMEKKCLNCSWGNRKGESGAVIPATSHQYTVLSAKIKTVGLNCPSDSWSGIWRVRWKPLFAFGSRFLFNSTVSTMMKPVMDRRREEEF